MTPGLIAAGIRLNIDDHLVDKDPRGRFLTLLPLLLSR
jgi:hypothetical protein